MDRNLSCSAFCSSVMRPLLSKYSRAPSCMGGRPRDMTPQSAACPCTPTHSSRWSMMTLTSCGAQDSGSASSEASGDQLERIQQGPLPAIIPIPGVSGESLAQGMRQVGSTPVTYFQTLDELVRELSGFLQPGDVFLTLGAGSITRVGPLWLEETTHA